METGPPLLALKSSNALFTQLINDEWRMQQSSNALLTQLINDEWRMQQCFVQQNLSNIFSWAALCILKNYIPKIGGRPYESTKE